MKIVKPQPQKPKLTEKNELPEKPRGSRHDGVLQHGYVPPTTIKPDPPKITKKDK